MTGPYRYPKYHIEYSRPSALAKKMGKERALIVISRRTQTKALDSAKSTLDAWAERNHHEVPEGGWNLKVVDVKA